MGRGAGIFACEAHQVFESWPTGTFGNADGVFSANMDVFMHIWQQVFDGGVYESHDWTVKVDPDCVFSPGRLRPRLMGLHVKTDEAVYVRNTGVSIQFLGPIEVLSKAATKKLSTMHLAQRCPPSPNGGEDGWLRWCMDAEPSIGYRQDFNLLESDNQVDTCWNHAYVAYHAFKDPGAWNTCMDRAS